MNFGDRSGFNVVQVVKELPVPSAVSVGGPATMSDRAKRDVNPQDSIIHPDDIGEIRRQAKQFGFHDAYVLPASEIIVAKWVEMKCRYGCANYDTSWCCPPAAPGLEETRLLIGEYELALLLVQARKGDGPRSKPGVNRRHQIQMWKATVALERKLFLMGYYKAFGMPSEACALCKECAYPRPCKFPNEKRPSIEACSIDVFQIAKNLGRSPRVAGNKADEYESYSLILIA
jgi:predicted metal-binding protein